jgi:EAL domain-containing protein (putative c-di-GMP-specific phosphodiesterase class I)
MDISGPLLLREAIRHAADPMEVMQRAVDQALTLIPAADGASFEMRRPDGLLEYVCAAGALGPFVGLTLSTATSLSGRAISTRHVERSDDTEVDPRVDQAACRRTGIRSMLCLPLTLGGEGVAVLKVSSARPHAFTEDDAGALEHLTEFLGVAVSAAHDVARATEGLLEELPEGDGDRAGEAARFVAGVMAPGLVPGLDARRRIEQVLDQRSWFTVLQPVVDLRHGQVVAVEALTRFTAEPLRTPDVWFAEAHTVGLGVQLELACLADALRLLGRLPSHVRMQVNVGPDTLVDPRLLTALSPYAGEPVGIELTEHEQVRDYTPIAEALATVRALGMRVAVDDTGNGYASLAHILSMRPDIIKLDRSLTVGIAEDPARQALATALVHFAVALDAEVVAEGVETEAEARTVVDLGVWHGQGWFLGRPAPPDELDLTTRWHRDR